MQLCQQCSCGRGLHRSSGLQKAQAIRMTKKKKRCAAPLRARILLAKWDMMHR